MSVYKNDPHLVYKIWGGQKLAALKNLTPNTDPSEPEQLGETWEVSVVEGACSKHNGEDLSSLISKEQCPYLVKFIDTSDNLSVQVHPGDVYAKKHEGQLGKTECWLILAAKRGAGIFLGVKDEVSSKEFFQAIESKEDLTQYLNFFPVSKGDFFYVPAGAIHAIGKDVTLLEVQQSSGVTYRVWDWGRTDQKGNSRELHLKKAKDVINFDKSFNHPENFSLKLNSFHLPKGTTIIEHENFSMNIYHMDEKEILNLNFSSDARLGTIICTRGELEVRVNGKKFVVAAFQTISFLKEKDVEVYAETQSNFLLVN